MSRLAEFFREALLGIFWTKESQLVSAGLFFMCQKEKANSNSPPPPHTPQSVLSI